MKNDRIHDQIKSSGLKCTPHRMEVLAMLSDLNEAFSAEDIYRKLSDAGYVINLSTVYRTLDSLVEKRLIARSVLMDQSKALYEMSGRMHRHYLICTGCNRKVELEDCPVHRIEHELAAQTGFRIEAHRLEIYGLCPECWATQSK